MRILISNDDGIHAPGIRALVDALKPLGEIYVVAPDSERSAVGHAITISDPIKAREIHKDGELFGTAVSGTPADCVKLAVCALLPEPPDLIVSGINLGPNAGISVIYSGTVSAATEGTILGIPSMALSLCTFSTPRWETAAHVAQHVVKLAYEQGIPKEALLNVNIPNIPIDELKGYEVTHMGHSRFVETFERRTDPRGNVYYWMDGELKLLSDSQGTDVEAIKNGYVSISCIGLDHTDRKANASLSEWPFGDAS